MNVNPYKSTTHDMPEKQNPEKIENIIEFE